MPGSQPGEKLPAEGDKPLESLIKFDDAKGPQTDLLGKGFDKSVHLIFEPIDPIIIVKDQLPSILNPSTDEGKIKNLLLDLYSFTGERSNNIPATGIWSYAGKTENQVTEETYKDITFIINWSNNRIFGLESGTHTDNGIDTGFGFGVVNANGSISDIHIFGSDAGVGSQQVFALGGSQTFGHVYGQGNEFLGIAMEGYDISLQNPSSQLFWNEIIGAKISSKVLSTPSDYTGTDTWNGFFVGVSENMANPSSDRRIFSNTDASQFSLTLNKNDGTVSGSLSGTDFDLPANIQINSLTIGDSTDLTKSAYIKDDLWGAELEGNAVSIYGSSTSVKTYGSYLVAKEETPLSTYTTWGYWETAYVDPTNNATYHIHVPGSLWVAGYPTDASRVQSYWIDNNFSGVYSGLAKGIMIDTVGNLTELENGQTNLTIAFSSASPVSGSISFTGHTLTIDSTNSSVTSSGFTADITGSSTSNAIKGAFYGPDAEAVAGSFNADKSGTRYHGIFAGNRP